jgi:hypothetical protein
MGLQQYMLLLQLTLGHVLVDVALAVLLLLAAEAAA